MAPKSKSARRREAKAQTDSPPEDAAAAAAAAAAGSPPSPVLFHVPQDAIAPPLTEAPVAHQPAPAQASQSKPAQPGAGQPQARPAQQQPGPSQGQPRPTQAGQGPAPAQARPQQAGPVQPQVRPTTQPGPTTATQQQRQQQQQQQQQPPPQQQQQQQQPQQQPAGSAQAQPRPGQPQQQPPGFAQAQPRSGQPQQQPAGPVQAQPRPGQPQQPAGPAQAQPRPGQPQQQPAGPAQAQPRPGQPQQQPAGPAQAQPRPGQQVPPQQGPPQQGPPQQQQAPSQQRPPQQVPPQQVPPQQVPPQQVPLQQAQRSGQPQGQPQGQPGQAQPSAQQAASEQKLPEQFAGLEIKDRGAPLEMKETAARKPAGLIGRKARLTSNLFKVEVKPQNFYRYLVEFYPPVDPAAIALRKSKLSRHSFELKKVFGAAYTFDGTNLLSMKEQRKVPPLEDPTDGSRIDIELKATIPTKDVHKPEVQGIFNMLVKIYLRELKLIQFGRNYFYPKPDRIGDTGLQMFKGFTLTVNSCVSGMMACIDLTHRVCSLTSVRHTMDAIEDVVRRGAPAGATETMIREETIKRHEKVFKGSVVLAMYNKRIWKVDGIDYGLTIDSKFDTKDKKQISFKEYYSSHYKLNCPPKPGLLFHMEREKGKFEADGTTPKMRKTVLIPDFCYLTGVTDEITRNSRIMKQLADYTRKNPTERMNSITQLMTEVNTNADVKQAAKALEDTFRMSVTPVSVDSRIFEPFDVVFNKSAVTIKGKKNFSSENRDAGFISKSNALPSLSNWTIVCERAYEKLATDVGRNIMQISRKQGGEVGQYVLVTVPDTKQGAARTPSWRTSMQQIFSKAKPALAFFIIPDGDEALYSFVKNQCAVEHGVISQVLKPDTVEKNPKNMLPVCGNIFKQMFAKMGHTQWKVDLKKKIANPLYLKAAANTMFVGVDVSHDKKIKAAYASATAPNPTTAPSVVGFCATYDIDHTQCNSWTSRQGKDEEYVRESCDLMYKALQAFKAKRGVYPENVIVYRDGVGDSQLETFVRREILEYNNAFAKLAISPKLTAIVVQKRLLNRFFEECEVFARRSDRCSTFRCNGDQKYHCPTAGSVVDTVVVSAKLFDFFIIPCEAPPGATSRPTRYIVVRDDMNWSSDDLQIVSHQLCYMYPNWQGPIRVPSMVMFAHRMAYLFGKYVNGTPNPAISDKLHYL